MMMAALRVGKPGEHPGQFAKAGVLLDYPHSGSSAFPLDHDVRIGEGRHLGKVADAERLAVLGQAGQL